MTEFSVGDRVESVNAGLLPGEREIRAIYQNSAWVSGLAPTSRGMVIPLQYLTKVAPRFEVGKKYRYVGKYNNLAVVEVVDTRGEKVIGWLDNGAAWIANQISRPFYEEIAEEDVDFE